MSRKRTVFLIGFSGCGKTTLGKRLAHQWKVPFIDTDEVIEALTGKTISRIFAEQGEQYFRALESELLVKLTEPNQPPGVIALGGGTMISPANRKLTQKAGDTVYLSCSQNELYRRLLKVTDRPLLTVKPRRGETVVQARKRNLSAMLTKRLPGYKTADIRLSTTGKTVDKCIRELKKRIAKMV